MKKIYVQPNVKVVKITSSPVMITGSNISNTEAQTDALARRSSFSTWEEEDE